MNAVKGSVAFCMSARQATRRQQELLLCAAVSQEPVASSKRNRHLGTSVLVFRV
jgi:hypothetical protein